MKLPTPWSSRLIEKQFTHGLSESDQVKLFAILKDNNAHAATYQRYHDLEAALCQSPKPTLFAIERMEGLIINQTLAGTAKASRRFVPVWLASSAALSTLAVLVFALLLPWQNKLDHQALPENARFSPVVINTRGQIVPRETGIGIRVFCVVAEDTVVKESIEPSYRDVLTFTYSNVAKDVAYLTLLGIQNKGDVRWYYPDYEGSRSISIERNVVDEPLGDGIKLSVNHEPGDLRIVALFSAEPLNKALVEQAAKNMSPSQLTPLMGQRQDVLEHSVLIRIAEPMGEE